MKKLIFNTAIILLLMGCSSESKDSQSTDESSQTDNVIATTLETESSSSEIVSEKTNEELESIENNESTGTIDTSIFDLAKEVNVTDARDITQHITLQIVLKDNVKQGNGVQGVLTSTYDFLQQQDIVGANSITIFVNSDQLKIFQITIDTTKFKTNDEISMIQLVLDASEIEKMTDEVKTYGKILELW